MNLFNEINLKEFELLKYISQNTKSPHVTCIIKILLQSDKIETPYYMDTEISLSYCMENHNKGIVHAMDVLKHHRMYNLTEEKFNEFKKTMKNFENTQEKTIKTEFTKNKQTIEIQTLNTSKLKYILEEYKELFEKIDQLA